MPADPLLETRVSVGQYGAPVLSVQRSALDPRAVLSQASTVPQTTGIGGFPEVGVGDLCPTALAGGSVADGPFRRWRGAFAGGFSWAELAVGDRLVPELSNGGASFGLSQDYVEIDALDQCTNADGTGMHDATGTGETPASSRSLWFQEDPFSLLVWSDQVETLDDSGFDWTGVVRVIAAGEPDGRQV